MTVLVRFLLHFCSRYALLRTYLKLQSRSNVVVVAYILLLMFLVQEAKKIWQDLEKNVSQHFYFACNPCLIVRYGYRYVSLEREFYAVRWCQVKTTRTLDSATFRHSAAPAAVTVTAPLPALQPSTAIRNNNQTQQQLRTRRRPVIGTLSIIRPHSARTGTLFSQLTAAVVRHKANDDVLYAIWAWFKYDTALSGVV